MQYMQFLQHKKQKKKRQFRWVFGFIDKNINKIFECINQIIN